MHHLSFRIFCFVIVSVSAIQVAKAQLVNQWQNMSSMFAVNAITSANGMVYAGTKGGVFSIDIASGTKEYWRVSDTTLLSSTITAIAHDPANQVLWIGAENGAIMLFNLQNNTWTSITALLTAQPQGVASKRIRAFAFYNGITYCAGDFGVLTLKDNIPGDWIKFIGSIPSGTVINDVMIMQDTIWVGTEKGLAKASINAVLQDINSWTVINTNAIMDLEQDNASLLVAESNALKRITNGIIETLNIAGRSGLNGISMQSGILRYSTANGIYAYPSNEPIAQFPQDKEIMGHHAIDDGICIAYIQSYGIPYGLIKVQNSTVEFIQPNTPAGSKYGALAVDNASRLWVNMDEGFVGVYENGFWRNFFRSEIFGSKTFANSRFNALTPLSDGTMWIGSFGNGYAIGSKQDDSIAFTIMDDISKSFIAINGGDYAISGKAAEERDGSLWIPRLTSTINDGALIVKKKKDGTYMQYQGSISKRNFTIAEIDNAKTIWIGAPTYNNGGDGSVYYFNEKNTSVDEFDDISGTLAISDIRVIKKDASGFMWFGTGAGLSVIFSPSSIVSGRQPNLISISALSRQVVNDIAIDAVNNKWIATDNGLFVLSEDGSEILATYTKSNTIFQSSAIKTIAIDNKQAIVYVGTDEGLYRGITSIVTPSTDYSCTKCYPQPFYPGIHPGVTIDCLAEESGISIVTPSGMPVRQLKTQSGRVIWDGKNEQGEFVASGVYLIVMQSGNQDQSGIIKCAVIRR
jgi:ligand-binding sensor domain-containing protein